MSPTTTNINNNSDLGITCSCCGAIFSGKEMYHLSLVKMFNEHKCEREDK